MKITEDFKLAGLAQISALADIWQSLMPDPILFNFSAKQLADDNFWNAASIVNGLNRILELREQGYLVYHKYGEDPEQFLFYFPAGRPKEWKDCIFLCAGGGYSSVCSMVEGFPIATHLNAMGIPAIVVNYHAGEGARMPNPIHDLALAIRFVMAHQDEWELSIENYAVAGFSAGAHLTGCFGSEKTGYRQYGLPAPAALFLSYAPVRIRDFMGTELQGFCETLRGKGLCVDEKFLEVWSLDHLVTDSYPPTYLWNFDHDRAVPGEHTMILAKALESHGISCLYRSFPGTQHGWWDETGAPMGGWLAQAVSFWQAQTGK